MSEIYTIQVLDHLFEAGVSELFAAVCVHVLRVFGIEVCFAHIDTTAFRGYKTYQVPDIL